MKKTNAVLTRARRKVLILGRRRRCRLEGRESRRVVPAGQFVSLLAGQGEQESTAVITTSTEL